MAQYDRGNQGEDSIALIIGCLGLHNQAIDYPRHDYSRMVLQKSFRKLRSEKCDQNGMGSHAYHQEIVLSPDCHTSPSPFLRFRVPGLGTVDQIQRLRSGHEPLAEAWRKVFAFVFDQYQGIFAN
jgi:hypothetical protein